MYLLAITPANIAAKNNKDSGLKKTSDDIAGPGHSPANPHPAPNKAEPKSNLRSILVFVGSFISKPREDLFLLRNKKKKGAVNKIPPPITKINEASQL